jgi:hypothetical protein
METPWGPTQHVSPLGAEGILEVSTPGHGGIFVPDHLLPRIPAGQRAWAKKWARSENWYEEDCCWACVAVAWPELFDADNLAVARRIISDYEAADKISV